MTTPQRPALLSLIAATATAVALAVAGLAAPPARAAEAWTIVAARNGEPVTTLSAGQGARITATGSDCAGTNTLWFSDGQTLRWRALVTRTVTDDTNGCTLTEVLPSLKPSVYRFAVTAGGEPTATTPTRTLRVNPSAVTLTAPSSILPTDKPVITMSAGAGSAGSTAEIRALVNGVWTIVGKGRLDATGRLRGTLTQGVGTSGRIWLEAHVWLSPTVTTRSAAWLVTRETVFRATTHTATAAELGTTWRAGCPVAPSGLTVIEMNHWNYSGTVSNGMLVVSNANAPRVVAAFKQAFAGRQPIQQMKNPTLWGADDVKVMAAGNTNAFNCRSVVGNPYVQSPHSYGIAIDINQRENPYRDPQGRWYPTSTYAYNRPASVKGLHTSSSPIVVALKAQGFDWYSGWDWHHFER
ncbi:M15 family metallopeptidase [Aestuariimicrobium soli]|uniref:M15 family metallopeptidase n=1 Tax=Aestuariimicrobium soli TaxID=2035834 RepID=UPI003EB9EDF4